MGRCTTPKKQPEFYDMTLNFGPFVTYFEGIEILKTE